MHGNEVSLLLSSCCQLIKAVLEILSTQRRLEPTESVPSVGDALVRRKETKFEHLLENQYEPDVDKNLRSLRGSLAFQSG